MRGDSWSNGIAGAVRAGEVDRGSWFEKNVVKDVLPFS